MNLCNLVTIFDYMKWGEGQLIEAGKNDAAIDAKLLMKELLGYNETQLLFKRQEPLDEALKDVYEALIKRRASGIPLQHITHEQEFMGLSFYVDENVLIPRQDTETLIEELIAQDKVLHFKTGIDIGTGSGCISISLAYYIKDLQMMAIDLSEAALKVAKRNIKMHHLESKVNCLQSDLLEAYPAHKKVDLIVSNPPYISKADVEELAVEVACHEPRMALTDEGDGLWFYQQISKQAKAYLNKGGMLAYEIGYNQAKEVTTILKEEGYSEIKLLQDLAGKDRVITARWLA